MAVLTLGNQASANCFPGKIEGGSWTTIKSQPGFEYIDLNVLQQDGTSCRLSMKIDAAQTQFQLTTEPINPKEEQAKNTVFNGAFAISDADDSKAQVVFEYKDGATGENKRFERELTLTE